MEQSVHLICGAAERCVTPPLGRNIPQCMALNLSTGVKDDLYTHALYLESDGRAVLLISIDTSGLGMTFSRRVRKAISAEIPVSEDAIMVSAIHIHTGGPQLMDVFWGQGRDPEVEELFLRETVAAATEAYRERTPVTAHFAEGKENRVGFCRNYRMRDGRILTNPGRRGAPDIVSPVTAIDDTLSSLLFRDKTGASVAQIVNFACHPDTIGGKEYSADYPGELRRRLKAANGDGCTVLFFNGCSGNVNHIDAMRLTDPDFRYPKDHYKVMGQLLAEKVLSMHRDSEEALAGTAVDFAVRRFYAERRQPSEEDLAWADAITADPASRKVDQRLAQELYALKKHPKRFALVEIQAIRIGDVALVGFPGEPFSDMGLQLRKRSPFGRLLISELANDELGYFATEPAYSGRVYEAILPSAVFTPAVLDRMIDTAEALLQSFNKTKRGTKA